MTISIKTPTEQDAMRLAGRLTADVLDMIGPYVQPGVSTDELDRICTTILSTCSMRYPPL